MALLSAAIFKCLFCKIAVFCIMDKVLAFMDNIFLATALFSRIMYHPTIVQKWFEKHDDGFQLILYPNRSHDEKLTIPHAPRYL